MTAYGSIDLPESWGIDTAMAGVLTDEQLQRLAAAKRDDGTRAAMFLWGYVPLPGMVSRWDMTGERARAACDAGIIVLLVQHCRSGAWLASAEQGSADGQHAAEYASKIGYPDDCHLALDDESVRNPGPDAVAHMTAWCRARAAACLYEGFAPGLTAQQEYELPDVARYWGAYGPWDVAVRGVCCRQGLQTTIAGGITVDTDHAAPDKLGGVLRGMCRTDLWLPNAPTDPAPAGPA